MPHAAPQRDRPHLRLVPTHGGGPAALSAIPPEGLDTLVVPNGYDWSPLISWGDPVQPGAPVFDVDAQTPQAQARQFGYNNGYVGVLPLDRYGDRALLVVHHEYTHEVLMFRGWSSATGSTEAQARIAMAAHGMSVVEIERVDESGEWRPARRRRLPYNRRVHLGTPFLLTGPAAGSPSVRTSADLTGRQALGTLASCTGVSTPWGTVLSGEQDVGQYFGASADLVDPETVAALSRYGFPTRSTTTDRRFEAYERRFDLAREPNEANRFGWIVELDPYDPHAPPGKRTALGRLAHQGVRVRLAADGRVVASMRDAERPDHRYEFVSRRRYRPEHTVGARRHNLRLLDEGDLYVELDGGGRRIPLVVGGTSRVPGLSVERVLVHTRLAADEAGRVDPGARARRFAGHGTRSQVRPIPRPDRAPVDDVGDLWIAVPTGAECRGPFLTDDARTALVAVQHPGQLAGASVDHPRSTFPHGDGPRPTVVTVWRTGRGSPRIGA